MPTKPLSTPPNTSTEKKSRRKTAEENEESPFRVFVVAVAVAIVLGLSIRFYFSSDRLHEWAQLALAQQPSKMKIEFTTAELKLADGPIPQFAVELQGLKLTKVLEQCPEIAMPVAVEADRLRIPLRVLRLFSGQVSIGTLSASGLSIDLDRLKTTCPETPKNEQRKTETAQQRSKEKPTSLAPPVLWWSDDDFAKIANAIQGFSFRNARVIFENGTKWVELETVSANIKSSTQQIQLHANIRIPKALTQGEQIPDLVLDGAIAKDKADATLAARLSEGTVRGGARLTPAADRQLGIEAHVDLANVPLSTLVPLLYKTALVKHEMRPKFLWLNCSASIRGKFQGLLQENPLELSNCEIQGHGTDLKLARAVRLPSGKWEPFTAQILSADVRQVLEAFAVSGLDGVINDYGRMKGEVHVGDQGFAKISATFQGAQLRFSNRSIRVLQDLKTVETSLEVRPDGSMSGEISKVEFDGGEFEGKFRFDNERQQPKTNLELSISSLKLADDVQRVMLGGAVGKIHGEVSAALSDGKLTALKGGVHFVNLTTLDWDFADLLLQPGLDDERSVTVSLKSPELRLKSSSPVFTAARSLVFHLPTFDEPEVIIRDFSLPAVVPNNGGLRWKNAKGTLEKGKVRISSEGGFSRDHDLSGTVQMDYPKMKKLAWEIGGTTSEPEFEFSEKSASDSFNELIKDSKVTEASVGLPPSHKGSESRDESSISGDPSNRAATNTTTNGTTNGTTNIRGAGERLREFGESFIEKAREMIPNKARSGGNAHDSTPGDSNKTK